jgi:hypothetical protein
MLEGIFKYQKNIMDEYVKRGMLPAYPVPINSRPGQEQIKKIMGWVIEEIGETSMQYNNTIDHYLNEPGKDGLIKMLDETFMEVADALHFFVELMIFSGIEAEDVLTYYEALAKERNLDSFITSDGLTTSDNYAQHTNVFDDPVRVARYYSVSINMEPMIKPKLSEDLHIAIQLVMWETVRSLTLTSNLLKKRDWSESERETSITSYQLKLMESWLYFMKFINLMGFDAKALYYYYERKNLIVQERLANKY